MTSAFFDAGDLQRLDRERTLTEQAPRQLPEDDRSPDEEPVLALRHNESKEDFDVMLEGILLALKRRL